MNGDDNRLVCYALYMLVCYALCIMLIIVNHARYHAGHTYQLL